MEDSKRRATLARKSKKIKITHPEKDDETQNCIVCLDKVVCRGKLGVCQHWFCFSCILEWSKNTNTCPVCKKTFRCISKVHLVPGKSPEQKVRVKDVDQRCYQDDEEFIWDEFISTSENETSDYEPSNTEDDPEDETFQANSSSIDLGESDDDDSSIEISSDSDSDSDAYIHTSFDEDVSMASESDEGSSPILRSRSSRLIISDDDEDSSDMDTSNIWWSSEDSSGGQSDNKSQTKPTKKKPQKTSKTETEVHAKRKKHQKSSNRKFEAELERRKHSPRSTRATANIKGTGNTAKEASGSCIGRWLRTGNVSSQASNSQRTSSRNCNARSQGVNRRYATETSVTFRSNGNSSRSIGNNFRSTANNSRFTKDNSRSTKNDSTSTGNNGTSTRNNSKSTRNNSKSTRNNSKSTRSNSKSQPSVLPKRRSHKRLTFRFESDSESSSSEDSWNPSKNTSNKPTVAARSRQTTTTKRSENRQKIGGPSRVLKEVQIFFD